MSDIKGIEGIHEFCGKAGTFFLNMVDYTLKKSIEL